MKIKKRIVAVVLTLLLLQNSISAFASGMGKYQINVVDNLDTSNKISGAEFNVLSNGSVVDRVTTDGSGVAKMELPNGSYELEQVSTAGGYYITDETISFIVDSKKDEGIYIANMQESVAAGGYAPIAGSYYDKFYVNLTLENGSQNGRPGKFYVFTKDYAENVRDMKPEDIYDYNNILGVYETDALGVLRSVDSEALTSDICREYDGDPAECVDGKIPRPYARLLGSVPDNSTPYPIAYVFVEDGKGPSQVKVTEIGNDGLENKIYLLMTSNGVNEFSFRLQIGDPSQGKEETGDIYLSVDNLDTNEPIAFSKKDGTPELVVKTTGGTQLYYFAEDLPNGTQISVTAHDDKGRTGTIIGRVVVK